MAGEKQRVNLVLAGRRQAILVAFEARKLVREKRIAVIECSGDYKAGGAECRDAAPEARVYQCAKQRFALGRGM